jgi:hypothetical protein
MSEDLKNNDSYKKYAYVIKDDILNVFRIQKDEENVDDILFLI